MSHKSITQRHKSVQNRLKRLKITIHKDEKKNDNGSNNNNNDGGGNGHNEGTRLWEQPPTH